MSNLSQSITSVCHQLIEKPDNLKSKTEKQYHKQLEKTMENSEANQ